MNDLMRNFILGIASIIALIGFAVLLMFFGELKLFPPNRYDITIHMNMASGLRAGSPVELNGVRIGTVQSISLSDAPENPDYPVLIKAQIEKQFRIPRPIQAKVDRSLLAGTAILQMVGAATPDAGPDDFFATDGTASINVMERPLVDQILAELDERTAPLIDALKAFNELSETYVALGQNLNELVRPLDPERDTPDTPNVRQSLAKFNSVLDDARQALKMANTWLSDDQLRADASHAVANARTLTEQATKTIEQYGRLAEKLEGDADEVLKAVLPLADELTVTLGEVRGLIRTAADGRGTIAQLLNNPDLYESLQDASERLEQALTDVRLFIQKVRTEGLPTRLW